MSPIKEPRFFALEGDALDYHGPDDPASSCEYTNLSQYLTLFKGVKNEKAIGEASGLYLYYSQKAAKNIKHYMPNAKLIAILRNPIERAYFNYIYALREGRETAQSFREALILEEQRISQKWGPHWHYKSKGFYATQLKPYFERFNQKQLAIYLYDDLKSNPQQFCQNIYHFLGVDTHFCPNTSQKYKIDGLSKSLFLYKWLKKPSPLKKLTYIFPRNYRKYLKEKIAQINTKTDTPPFLPEERYHLMEVYRKEILALQEMIGRDLSHWLEV